TPTPGMARGTSCSAVWAPGTVRAGPWRSKAPMSTVPPTMRVKARWSVVSPAGTRRLLPALMAGAAGGRGTVGGGPAVACEGAGLDAEQVGGREAAAAGGVADQVVALAGQRPEDVRDRGGGGVAGDDRVPDDRRAAALEDAAGAVGGGVAAEGAVGHRQRAKV